MIVSDIQRFSIHDGDGIRTLVFFKGCPLRCIWCDNPESQESRPEILFNRDKCLSCQECIKACPLPSRPIETIRCGTPSLRTECDGCGRCVKACSEEALKLAGRQMTVDEVMDIVKKDVPYYRHGGGGVTVSGGEAALYPAFIKDLFRKCRRLGISTAIETCGCVPWKNYERFLDETDIVLYDLKHMNRKLHKEYTGKSNELILENAKRIACHRVNMVVRIPLVPTLTATEENLRNTGEFVIRHLPGVRKAHILPFHQLGKAKYVNLKKKYSLIELKAPSFSEIDRAKEILEACGLVVEIGG